MQRGLTLPALIENTRSLMYESIKTNGITSNETLLLSQKLDVLISIHQINDVNKLKKYN